MNRCGGSVGKVGDDELRSDWLIGKSDVTNCHDYTNDIHSISRISQSALQMIVRDYCQLMSCFYLYTFFTHSHSAFIFHGQLKNNVDLSIPHNSKAKRCTCFVQHMQQTQYTIDMGMHAHGSAQQTGRVCSFGLHKSFHSHTHANWA